MKIVLGIDAAWTEKEPSGVALIIESGAGWELAEVAPSYERFLHDTGAAGVRHRGSVPDPTALVAAAARKAGASPDIVAVDMPLSKMPIVSRRCSDNIVSSLYGARHASKHTPSATRPGRMSDDFRAAFEAIGYSLTVSQLTGRSLIEVYPHTALIELAAADRRLPYKHAKTRKYWPEDLPSGRRARLLEVWNRIIGLLDEKIRGVAAALPLPEMDSRAHEMKAFEDTLDAVVCAWVGACAIDGKAEALGDETSAIWVPRI
nr:hypothetical protein REQ54_01623 [Rhizobium sp. Q54]